jgi:hypothetical protein
MGSCLRNFSARDLSENPRELVMERRAVVTKCCHLASDGH